MRNLGYETFLQVLSLQVLAYKHDLFSFSSWILIGFFLGISQTNAARENVRNGVCSLSNMSMVWFLSPFAFWLILCESLPVHSLQAEKRAILTRVCSSLSLVPPSTRKTICFHVKLHSGFPFPNWQERMLSQIGLWCKQVAFYFSWFFLFLVLLSMDSVVLFPQCTVQVGDANNEIYVEGKNYIKRYCLWNNDKCSCNLLFLNLRS